MPAIQPSHAAQSTRRPVPVPIQTTAIVETHRFDEDQVIARLVLAHPGREPRLLSSSFADTTHARAVARATRAMVRFCVSNRRAMQFILPDRVVVDLLHGIRTGESQRLGDTIAQIRHMVDVEGAQVSFSYGTLRSVIGEAADQIEW